MRDGRADWTAAALAANANLFLDDFLTFDVSKPITDASRLEIEKRTIAICPSVAVSAAEHCSFDRFIAPNRDGRLSGCVPVMSAQALVAGCQDSAGLLLLGCVASIRDPRAVR